MVIPADDGGRFYGRAEYLLWWTKDSPLRTPLVTTGLLDQADTRIILGGNNIDTGNHNGGRLTFGVWLNEDHTWGLEASGFYLPTVTRQQGGWGLGGPGGGRPVRPFVGPARGRGGVTGIAPPGGVFGTAG